MIHFWAVVSHLCMEWIESPGCLQCSCPKWQQRPSPIALSDHPDGDTADECHSSVGVLLPFCVPGAVETDKPQISKAT